MIKLKPAELRTKHPTEKEFKSLKKNPIYIVLDNVMDTYNVGAIFRLADAVAAEKVYLCGQTETPPNTRIKKASINTTEWMKWEYCETAVEAIQKIRNHFSTPPWRGSNNNYSSSDPAKPGSREVQVVAIEQDSRSAAYDSIQYTFPIALVVGNETTGVSKEVLDVCDQIVELPMFGVNVSLNVMVSLGIVLYKAVGYLTPRT